ncbi:hypothetical protein [Aeromonas caviae]|jgi:hypothetical protein|uniref:hypothetical protein n=1 Tax=Aeromonas caviae TaxID=648 RepID=UPI0029D45F34|nr:hypothetical protein [Aeromonas caviae]MDX7715154.1 hypothetical protein [Aeromonas caviae]
MFAFITMSSNSPTDRLAKVLKENKNKLTLTRDGVLSLNLDNKDVKDAIHAQIIKLERIKEEPNENQDTGE